MGYSRQRVIAPTYRFQRRRFWVQGLTASEEFEGVTRLDDHPLLTNGDSRRPYRPSALSCIRNGRGSSWTI